MSLVKGGSNWVDGDKFFDREDELRTLAERAREGTHTLLTAPRRMGKTSLLRESLRRLRENGEFETIFVDLEAASDPADAIAEIAAQSKNAKGTWRKIKDVFQENLKDLGERVDSVSAASLQVQFRASIAAGNRWRKGDELFSALAESEHPVVLAIDELPILINRLLRGSKEEITADGKHLADEFLGWLRKNGQAHRGRVIVALSGSVGLEPILHRAGLSAQANIYQPLSLGPWSEPVALNCLSALAEQYQIQLPLAVRRSICHRLRHLVPHHIQQFFDHIHEHLRREDRKRATEEDVQSVYRSEMLSVRGQADMEHYEGRLRTVLSATEYGAALELLTEAAVSGGLLSQEAVAQYREFHHNERNPHKAAVDIDQVLHQLEHDGYLSKDAKGYRFQSGLLQDWWLARHGNYFSPLRNR